MKQATLKRTRKKPKVKSRLQRQRENPSSTYWMARADAAWRDRVVAIGSCEMCLRRNCRLEAHHLIRRDARFFRHNPENGLCLCFRCHTGNCGQEKDGIVQISAHGTPWAFEKWMEENRPGQFEWWNKNRWAVLPGVKINYKQVLDQLQEMPA